MAIVIQCEGSDEVSFKAFLDYVDAHVDTSGGICWRLCLNVFRSMEICATFASQQMG